MAEVLDQLDAFLGTLPAGVPQVIMGDFNARLPRSHKGLTGKYCIHYYPDQGGEARAEKVIRDYYMTPL